MRFFNSIYLLFPLVCLTQNISDNGIGSLPSDRFYIDAQQAQAIVQAAVQSASSIVGSLPLLSLCIIGKTLSGARERLTDGLLTLFVGAGECCCGRSVWPSRGIPSYGQRVSRFHRHLDQEGPDGRSLQWLDFCRVWSDGSAWASFAR